MMLVLLRNPIFENLGKLDVMDTYITLQQNDFRKPDWKHIEQLSGTTYTVKRAGWVHVQFGCGSKWMCINNILVAYSAHGGTMVTLPVSRTDKITVSDFEDMSHLLELRLFIV